MRVRVYRNLVKKCISVQSTKTNLVIMHSEAVSLRDCKFVVRQKGRERVLREKVKNVHAFVVGELDDVYKSPEGELRRGVRQASYNPYRYDFFYDVITNEPVQEASYVWVMSDGTIFYKEWYRCMC